MRNPFQYDLGESGQALGDCASRTVATREPSPSVSALRASVELSQLASAHWDTAAAALRVRDYPTFDREMAAYKTISATWKPREAGPAQQAPASNS